MHGEGIYLWPDGKKYTGKVISCNNNSLKKIKEKDMENWIGMMVEFIKANGRMANSMAKVHLFIIIIK
jgi:hypothetical protein